MKVQVDWLKEYVGIDAPAAELGQVLTMAGLEIESHEFIDEEKGDVLELNVTPNRGYCLSHLGVAREVSALMGGTFNPPDALQALGKSWGANPVAEKIAVENLEVLLKKLSRLRGLIHRAFATVVMIRPGLGQMKSKYHCRVELLTGISTPFQTKELQFTSPPASDYDFLTTPGSENCLRLAPLLKRGPHMESFEYSYYYYSRKSDQEVSFNNYHSTIVGTKEYPAEGETELLGFLSKLEA